MGHKISKVKKSMVERRKNTLDTEINKGPRIYLKRGQEAHLYKNVSKPGVAIFAPLWLKEALEEIEPQLLDVSFQILSNTEEFLDVFTLKKPISLIDLQKISRNEIYNASGIIKFELYHPSVDRKLVLTLKDLVRQCVIVGVDRTAGYGGFTTKYCPQSSKVYLCDLIGLQFSRPENTGRLVLIAPEDGPFTEGYLDDFIFQQVVGESKSTYKDAEKDSSGRYIPFNYRQQGTIFFDTYAYRKFVADDVILCGIALEALASQSHLPPPQVIKTNVNSNGKSREPEVRDFEIGTEETRVYSPTDNEGSKPSTATTNDSDIPNGDMLNFKFLKYGTGFFGGEFREVTKHNILPAVIDGLEELFRVRHPKHIKAVEFPFFDSTEEDLDRLEDFKAKYGVQYRISTNDSLKDTVEGLVTATTNCADPHAATGNETGYKSVDSATASNLESKGFIYCPLLNPDIEGYFVSIHNKSSL